jgi:transposase
MEVSYKFRIYPNKEQEQLIQKTFGCVRYVYNYFLVSWSTKLHGMERLYQ